MPDLETQVEVVMSPQTCTPESPCSAPAPGFTAMGNQAVARAVGGHSAQRAGGRCACGGTILPGGECSKCMSRRMKAEGASEDQIQRTVLARKAEAGLHHAPAEGARDADRAVATGMADAARARSTVARSPLDWLEDAGDWVADRASDVGEAAGDAAEWVGDRAQDVGEAAGDAAEWVGDRAQDVGEAAGDAAEWVGDRAQDVGEAVGDAARGVGEWVGDRVDDITRPVVIPGPRASRKVRAQAICKCVGDDKCGGGKIHKKYFHTDDCKNAKLEAEKICNNDEEMKKKCIRPKCYYRHGDYKCPA